MLYLEVFPSGPLQTNAILIGCLATKRAAVVDPSAGSLGSVIEQANVKQLYIEKILLTHSHWDHIADVAALKAATGAKVFVHAEDAENVRKPGADKLKAMLPVEGVEPDELLSDGQVVEVGQLKWEVLHTPGHSPGCVCFYLADEKVLLSGDTLFRGAFGTLSVPTADAKRMWPSLKRLAKLPLDTRVIPGHGKQTTLGREQWLERAKEFYGE